MLRSRKSNESDSISDHVDVPIMVEKDKSASGGASLHRFSIGRKPLEDYRGLILLSAILLIALRIYTGEQQRPPTWWFALTVFSIPVILSLAVVLGYGKAQPHQRIISLGVIGAVIGKQVPPFVTIFLALAGITLFHLSSRPDGTSKEDNQGRLKAAMAAIFLTGVLLTENFFVWVVAATYQPGIEGSPQPLQDNGQIVQRHLLNVVLGLSKGSIVHLRSILNVQWALAASLGVSFGVVDLQMVKGRTVWGLALRALLMLAALRSIRVISFLLTVLPSQNPNCYRHRFPPPPEDWYSWIEIGMRPQSHGGCNDLIISGHATVLTTFACFATSTAGHKLVSLALWSMLAIDFMLEVYEGFHYSVDMWLGTLIGCMLWRILAPLEEIDSTVSTVNKLKPLGSASLLEILAYSAPAMTAYIDIIFVPHNYQAYVVFGYLLVAGVHAVRHGFTHFLQMLLFSLMFLAISIWL